jgi:hypothetical protein
MWPRPVASCARCPLRRNPTAPHQHCGRRVRQEAPPGDQPEGANAARGAACSVFADPARAGQRREAARQAQKAARRAAKKKQEAAEKEAEAAERLKQARKKEAEDAHKKRVRAV